MYEERREKFSFKSFFLTLLLVVLFILLMLWLFPSKSYLDKKLGTSQTVYDLNRISVLYDEIFYNNITRMKDAAIGYYTNERMPHKVGESKKLTLKEMYDLHLVLKLKGEDGKECDPEKSYVKMTKFTEEYRLKVNLKCGSREDYIVVYLGCYNYCPTGICEKYTSTPSKKTAEEEKKYDEEEKKTYSCKVVNGKYYDKNGKVVSKKDYEKSCNTTPTPTYSCKVVDGKYYDKNGKVVSKKDYEKSCNEAPTPTYSCKVVDGKYYDKNGKVVGKAEYEASCNEAPTPTYSCKVVDGKYYDKNGKVVGKAEYEASCNPEVEKYLYEYKLTVPDIKTCGIWSNWQTTKVTATDLRKVETKTERQVVKYDVIKVPVTKTEKVKKQVAEKYIKEYVTELVKVGTKDIQIGTTTKTITERVAVGTVERKTGEIGTGTVVPQNTATRHYKIIGSPDTPESCSYCQDQTMYMWEVYAVETVYDVVTRTVTVPVYKTVAVYEKREVPVYGVRMVTKEEVVTTIVYEEKKVPVYGNMTYYRYQDCNIVKGYTDIKWSESKNDTTLTSKGYKFTGVVKKV